MSDKIPTPIVDKNGKATTVHKNPDGAPVANTRVAKAAGTPPKAQAEASSDPKTFGASLSPADFGGYEMKNMKSHNTWDGVAWTATIYKDGKKIGSAQQDGNGGMTMTYFESRELSQEFERFASEDWAHERYVRKYDFTMNLNSGDNLADELFEEADLKKSLNAAIRKGNLPMLTADDYNNIISGGEFAYSLVRGAAGEVEAVSKQFAGQGMRYFDGSEWVLVP